MSIAPSSSPIARQLALGFGAVSLVSVVMGLVLLVTIQDIASLVADMRHQEPAARHSLDLATAVREQSLHIAHTVVEGDTSHLDQYKRWRTKARLGIQTLAGEIPDGRQAQLQLLGEKTQRIHDIFISELVPLVKAGKGEQALTTFRQLDALGRAAAHDADALAQAVDTRMMHSHIAATRSARLGLWAGGLGALLVLGLASYFTLRLRSVVLRPLSLLSRSAHDFGKGNFESRVSDLGPGEIGDLGRAFNHMADELGERERRLVQRGRMAAIGQLAAGVAHELNNPIGIIRGYLKTMSPDEDKDTLGKELAILDEEAAHCQRIADDLVSYSRSSELDLEPTDMKMFISESVARYREGNEREGSFELTLAEAHCPIDRARIRQVLFNLLDNAVQISPEGSTIAIETEVESGSYQIDVADTGPGIEKEDRERIFEPFFSKRRGGSGLGLAVALGIVRSHDGTIEALEGPSGSGLLRVRLPLSGPVDAKMSLLPQEAP